MKVTELKFLLKLLGFPNYRAPLSDLKVGDKTSVTEQERLCRDLANRELIAYRSEIKKFKLDAPGKSLLKFDTNDLPITELELRVLEASRHGTITPAQTEIPAANRQSIIQGLAGRGLIKVTEEKIKDVWLTDRGQLYLRDECNPNGNTPISLNLLSHYLRFLRKAFSPEASNGQVSSLTAATAAQPFDDHQVLTIIQNLDRELGTENYLPIFYLREKVQPPLSRDGLDQLLYRLQRTDQIELSALQETTVYTPNQIEAGIPQAIGGPLFFITVS